MVYREIIYIILRIITKLGDSSRGGGVYSCNSQNTDIGQNHGFTNCLENLGAASKF